MSASASEFLNVEFLTEKGNQMYKGKNFAEAIMFYTQALEISSAPLAVLFYNRSMAFSAMNEPERAFEDAKKVVTIKPAWSMGYLRKGITLHTLGKNEEALLDFEEGVRLDSSNKELVQAKIALAKKIFRLKDEKTGGNQSLSAGLSTSADLPCSSTQKAEEEFKVAVYVFKKGRYMEAIEFFNSSMMHNSSGENVSRCTTKIMESCSRIENAKKGLERKGKDRFKSSWEVKIILQKKWILFLVIDTLYFLRPRVIPVLYSVKILAGRHHGAFQELNEPPKRLLKAERKLICRESGLQELQSCLEFPSKKIENEV